MISKFLNKLLKKKQHKYEYIEIYKPMYSPMIVNNLITDKAQYSVLYENKTGNSNYKYYCNVTNTFYKPNSVESHSFMTLYFDYSGIVYKGKLTNLVKAIYNINV